MKETLQELVDFDILNNHAVRLSVGAVNIRSGNFAYFDTHDMKIAPEHIMASGALPPGLPPMLIDGEAYWDGGLVSNTPLQKLMDWSQRTIVGGGGPRYVDEDVMTAADEVARACADLYGEKQRCPADDIMTVWTAAEIDGEPLGLDRVINDCLLLLDGGAVRPAP